MYGLSRARDRAQQRQRLGVERDRARLAGFRQRHQQRAPLPVDVVPLRLGDLVAPRAGEQQQHDRLRGGLVLVRLDRHDQALGFLRRQEAVALHVGRGAEADRRVLRSCRRRAICARDCRCSAAGSARGWWCRRRSPFGASPAAARRSPRSSPDRPTARRAREGCAAAARSRRCTSCACSSSRAADSGRARIPSASAWRAARGAAAADPSPTSACARTRRALRRAWSSVSTSAGPILNCRSRPRASV